MRFRQFIPHITFSRIKNAYKFFKRAFSGYEVYIALLAVLGFVSALLEGIGINVMVPLFSVFAGEGNKAGTDFISQTIRNFFDFIGLEMTLPALLLLIVVLFVGKSITLLIFDYVRIKITTNYEFNTRKKIFEKTLGANWRYLLTQKLGYLSTVIRTDIQQSSALLNKISSFVLVVTSVIVYAGVAFNISQTLTVFAFITGGIIFLILKPLLYWARKVSKLIVDMKKQVDNHINESITKMKAIKSFSKEDSISQLGNELFNKLRLYKVRLFIYRKIATGFVEPISVIFIASIVAFSYYNTSYNLGALAALVYLVHRIFIYMTRLQKNIHAVNAAVPYVESLLNYQHNAQVFAEQHKHQQDKDFSFNDKLELKDVHFSYNKEEVLKDINISIPKGKFIGLIGPSGGGKTTVCEIIIRLLEPAEGQMLLDGIDYPYLDLDKWRKNIAYVPQESLILSDTIANNIYFFDDNITEEDIKWAAEKADVKEFTDKMPEGLNTVINQDGVQLSTGQAQRIAIARALARKPSMLILDEVTSTLDKDSEKKIEKTLERIRGETTICAIAHRLSTIRKADYLYVIDKGTVVEEGSPKKLEEEKGTYFNKALS